MKVNLIKGFLSRTTGRTGLVISKHSPEILITAGVIGIVTSTVLACRATLKVHDVLDEYEEQKEKIEEIHNRALDGEDLNYSTDDYNKDKIVLTVQTAVNIGMLYGPAVLICGASIACIVGSHGIMKKRNVALVAAYKAIEKSFSDYRRRVVSEFGEEKDRLLKNGIIQSKSTVLEVDENGKTKKSTKVVESADPNEISQYAKFFDEASINWSKTPEYNLTFLRCQQNYANDLLKSRGHIFLNEVYDMLGIPRTQAGAIVGWVKEVGDGFVDFGIFDGERMAVRDFVNGYERNILLDFNVDGVIYDMI